MLKRYLGTAHDAASELRRVLISSRWTTLSPKDVYFITTVFFEQSKTSVHWSILRETRTLYCQSNALLGVHIDFPAWRTYTRLHSVTTHCNLPSGKLAADMGTELQNAAVCSYTGSIIHQNFNKEPRYLAGSHFRIHSKEFIVKFKRCSAHNGVAI